jgi:uncharacterized lipoprotein YddW (UPF0748 family)
MKEMKKTPGKRLRHFCFLLAVALCAAAFSACLQPAEPVSAAPENEFRGVWVPTVLTLSYPSARTTDPAALQQDALRILDNAKDLGFNAVFFQVRPTSDAFYKSAIFPWSKYLTGAQGLAPADGFDPLAFWVQAAHERGLQLHAWLNPYRITQEAEDNANLAANHPARLHPEWTVTHSDGRMYWNPGEPGAQQLIADGVREIVANYNVDGIHIDDYFYPGGDFDDSAAMAAYGGAYASVAEWRYANTETTVRNLYDIVHGSGKALVFGVSPMGIWANKSTSSLGSNTRGGEAYTQKFADTRGWVKRGIVDYIAPQIYWNIGFDVAEYTTLVDWWADVAEGTGVKLYIGQAAYRTGDADSASPWHGVAEIDRQLTFNRSRPRVDGYIMYAYNAFTGSPELYALMKQLNAAPGAGGGPGAGTDAAGPNAAGPGPAPADTTGAPAVETAVFPDADGHWAAAYIADMAAKGVVRGFPDGRFLPENSIKRADFVLMLTRMLGIGDSGGDAGFTDVTPDLYYAGALAAAKEQGWITGLGDGRFSPETPVTRQDMFTMTWRALAASDASAPAAPDAASEPASLETLDAFSDRGDVAAYAAPALAAFVTRGIVTGSEGRLAPLRTATRAETATILHRIAAQRA